jgi:ribulose-phosphate 3-epimerase
MIIPIIQTDSVDDLQAKLDTYAAIDLPGKPTHFQIDINDGLFTHHFSVQPGDLRHINWHGFTHEYHLLVDNPDEYLGDVSESGAVAVIAQIEHMHDRQNFIDTAKELNCKVGLALDFYTPVSELSDQELDAIDNLLLMSYKAGHSGPSLNQGIILKIQEVRNRAFTKLLEIDGGINPGNLPDLKAAGATAFAVNSAVWHDGTVKQNLTDLISAYAQKT